MALEEEADALHARLIRRLTAVIRQQVPRFWKLALSIFSGRFANFSEHARSGETPVSLIPHPLLSAPPNSKSPHPEPPAENPHEAGRGHPRALRQAQSGGGGLNGAGDPLLL